MDAAEADSDVKLYKASSELLSEVQAKVPRLVTTSTAERTFRKWIIPEKVSELTDILDRFQEWPQLLDPYLSTLIQVLVDAYVDYCVSCPAEYLQISGHDAGFWPLPRAIACVLYAFSKVRGSKIIVRLLNNEPKYVEPLLSSFRLWTSHSGPGTPMPALSLTWEERYISLLWLSHLMLAPFELSTISGLSVDLPQNQSLIDLCTDLPDVSVNLLMVGLDHLQTSNKSREAANLLLVRLALRGDMQKLGLTGRLVNWALSELHPSGSGDSTDYRYIGLLSLLFGIVNSASTSEASPFLTRVFYAVHTAATSTDEVSKVIRDSAPARKLLVKIMRSAVVHAIMLPTITFQMPGHIDTDSMLEDCIQVLLECLADKDAPVRQAASKALSMICLKLDSSMSAEVVEAVIDCLNENLLLEDVQAGTLFPITDIPRDDTTKFKKNVNAVDPLKWHGAMLTLGHLLFRRSLPTEQLPAVIEVLLMGLNFEQRSNVGTSIGVGVRDAACFGIWSLARKYSTVELNRVLLNTLSIPGNKLSRDHDQVDTLQTIATQLCISACLDPSGNLRRGASAALQELIGRHPDVIVQGIPIVQTIDYHAVARRSRAFSEVAVAASKLSRLYHQALLYGMLEWRGVVAADAESRRQAANAVGLLIASTPQADVVVFLQELVSQISTLKASNTGLNAAARHGRILALAAVVQQLSWERSLKDPETYLSLLRPIVSNLESVLGKIDSRINADLENVLEAASTVVLALSECITKLKNRPTKVPMSLNPAAWAESVQQLLDRCTVASDKDMVTNVSADANLALLTLMDSETRNNLLHCWLDPKQQKQSVYTCKGRTAAMGRVFEFVSETVDSRQFASRILSYLTDIVAMTYPVETKVNAMRSISALLKSRHQLQDIHVSVLVKCILSGLSDYSIDQRGDVGSLLRLESLEAAKCLQLHRTTPDDAIKVTRLVVRLACEKLLKVRFQAWKCFEVIVNHQDYLFDQRPIEHQTDVSSFEYFEMILGLLKFPKLRDQLVTGLTSSVAAGSEDVARVSSEALIALFEDHNASARYNLLGHMAESLLQRISEPSSNDDRDMVPAIDFLAFMFEHLIASQPQYSNLVADDVLWNACQTIQSSSPSMQRLEAMIRLYSSLTLFDEYRVKALEKLTRLLLHRWPKIRGFAGDAISLCSTDTSITMCDWNAPVAENKAAVLALRKALGVTSATSTSIQSTKIQAVVA